MVVAVAPEQGHLVFGPVLLLGVPGELADVAALLLGLQRIALDEILQRIGLAVGLELLHQRDGVLAAVTPFLGGFQLVDDHPSEENGEQCQSTPAQNGAERGALFLLCCFCHV
jgi:hypothetical protein